jgi:solute carrier family 45 protein 1/2/4
MVAIGSLIGYGFGAIDLSRLFGTTLGDSQFKQLIVVAGSMLLATVGTTCWAVSERVLVAEDWGKEADGEEAVASESFLELIRQIWTTAQNLPERIQAICFVQFWCWIGWFPFLFYSTTWLGEVYLRFNAPADAKNHPDSLGQVGRVGSSALVMFSIVTFASSVIMPWFIDSPDEDTEGFTPRPPQSLAWVVTEVQKHKPKLVAAWSYSHIIFAGSMCAAPFVTSLRAATAIVALCGIPWALACWAPFTFIGMEIDRLRTSNASAPGHKQRSSLDIDAEKRGVESTNSPSEDSAVSGDLSGVYLGILNVYTTLPQFIGTFISWVVFSILEPGKSPELAHEAHPSEHHSTDGPNAIAVCLFIGAIAAVVASYRTERYRKMIE